MLQDPGRRMGVAKTRPSHHRLPRLELFQKKRWGVLNYGLFRAQRCHFNWAEVNWILQPVSFCVNACVCVCVCVQHTVTVHHGVLVDLRTWSNERRPAFAAGVQTQSGDGGRGALPRRPLPRHHHHRPRQPPHRHDGQVLWEDCSEYN